MKLDKVIRGINNLKIHKNTYTKVAEQFLKDKKSCIYPIDTLWGPKIYKGNYSPIYSSSILTSEVRLYSHTETKTISKLNDLYNKKKLPSQHISQNTVESVPILLFTMI